MTSLEETFRAHCIQDTSLSSLLPIKMPEAFTLSFRTSWFQYADILTI